MIIFFIFAILLSANAECATYKGCKTSIICSTEDEFKWQANTWGWILQNPTNGSLQILNNFVKAISILESFGPLKSKDTLNIHVSFQYLCCYNLTDYEKIISIYKNVVWKPFKIYLSDVVCINNGDGNRSIIALVNDNTQNILSRYVSTIEANMIEMGINVIVPRSSQDPFHVTLAVVDDSYPISTALKTVNNDIRLWSTSPAVINVVWMDLPPHAFFPK